MMSLYQIRNARGSEQDLVLTFLFSMFLIHLIACPCGSTMSGHLQRNQITLKFIFIEY